jgi:hypothetical protein
MEQSNYDAKRSIALNQDVLPELMLKFFVYGVLTERFSK